MSGVICHFLQIFSFMLRLKRLSWVLRDIWFHLKHIGEISSSIVLFIYLFIYLFIFFFVIPYMSVKTVSHCLLPLSLSVGGVVTTL